jgi:peroxiredoxin
MAAEPLDDGLADHLTGATLPDIVLRSTAGEDVRLPTFEQGRWILFLYPRTGVPGQVEPEGWESIPGAKGCTAEACSFRDNLTSLMQAGVRRVAGLSVQSTDYQTEAVDRLHLPYPLLSDGHLALTRALRLPTFQAAGLTLLKRMTLVIDRATITHTFYPVFPVDSHVDEVHDWLQTSPASEAR